MRKHPKQKTFDLVATHLLTQKKRCTECREFQSVLHCVYRNADGLKCAAGCLIPDRKYSPEMEDITVEAVGKALSVAGYNATREERDEWLKASKAYNNLYWAKAVHGTKEYKKLIVMEKKYAQAVRWVTSTATFFGHDINLCLDLQAVHDQHNPSRWLRQLKKVAREHDLSTDCLNRFEKKVNLRK